MSLKSSNPEQITTESVDSVILRQQRIIENLTKQVKDQDAIIKERFMCIGTVNLFEKGHVHASVDKALDYSLFKQEFSYGAHRVELYAIRK